MYIVETRSELEAAVMKFFLFSVIAALYAAAELVEAQEHSYFPNFRSVYHGHGATSYQNVNTQGHNNIPFFANYKTYDSEHLHLGGAVHGSQFNSGVHNIPILPSVNERNYVHHSAIPEEVAYGERAISYANLEADTVSDPYLHKNPGHEYAYHL